MQNSFSASISNKFTKYNWLLILIGYSLLQETRAAEVCISDVSIAPGKACVKRPWGPTRKVERSPEAPTA